MIRRPISKFSRVLLSVISVAVLLLGYSALCVAQKNKNPSDTTVPNLVQLRDGVVRAFSAQTRITRETSADGTTVVTERRSFFLSWIWKDFTATWGRLLAGLALGILGGVAIGLMMGCYTPVEALLQTPLDFLSKIPPTAMLALFFVLFGTGFDLFIAMIAFGIMPTLAQAVHTGAKKHVPQELIDKAHTLGASQIEIIGNVIFRQIMPTIIEASRLCVGPAMVYLIAAEWLVADVGFGYRLRIQSRLLDMSVVYIYLVILAFAGYIVDLAMRRFIAWACPWYIKS